LIHFYKRGGQAVGAKMMEPTFEWPQAQPQDVVNSMGGSLQNASVQAAGITEERRCGTA